MDTSGWKLGGLQTEWLPRTPRAAGGWWSPSGFAACCAAASEQQPKRGRAEGPAVAAVAGCGGFCAVFGGVRDGG